MAQDKVHELTYMVGIPIPYLDRRGNPLANRHFSPIEIGSRNSSYAWDMPLINKTYSCWRSIPILS